MSAADNAVQSVRVLIEENRRLCEENNTLRAVPVTIGCARVSDLLGMDKNELAVLDSALHGFLEWVLSRPNGADDLTNGRFSTRLREVLLASGIGYIDGADDRRWNVDLKSTRLSDKQRLSAYVSDRRYWIFQASDANHETALAADTMLKLCEWRGIF
jgi:hypothetical protein